MNIREELNKLDQNTFNQYDLFNLYSSITVDKALKEQVVGLIKESKCEELCKLLSEAYEKQTGSKLNEYWENEDRPGESHWVNGEWQEEPDYQAISAEDEERDAAQKNNEKIIRTTKDPEELKDAISATYNYYNNYGGPIGISMDMDEFLDSENLPQEDWLDNLSFEQLKKIGKKFLSIIKSYINESLTETYENLPEIEDKVQGVTDQVTAKAVKDHEEKEKVIEKELKDADAEIKDEPFTSGEHQPKPEKPVVPDLIKEDIDDKVTIGLYGDEVPGLRSVSAIVNYFKSKGFEVSDVDGDIDYGWEMNVTGNPKQLFFAVVNKIPGYDSDSVQDFIDNYRIDESLEESVLNEGAGAGYTISGVGQITSIDDIEITSDVIADSYHAFVKFSCDAKGFVRNLIAESYDYTGEIEEEIPIEAHEGVYYLNDIDDAQNPEKLAAIISEETLHSRFHTKLNYGNGWGHSTWDGSISSMDYPLEIGSYADVQFTDAYVTDENAINYLDRAVTGDTQINQFIVYKDGEDLEVF